MRNERIQFVQLSEEVLVIILGDLDAQSLLTCKRVCRVLARIIAGSVYLKYNVELAVAGMVDCPSCEMFTADKLARLKRYRNSWDSLEFRDSVDLSTQAPAQHITSDGHTLVRILANDDVQAYQFSSDARGIQKYAWTVGFEVPTIKKMKCAVDTAQNLLIFVEKKETPGLGYTSGDLYVCLLSTGEAHPLAACPIIHISESSSDSSILVRGEIAAWMLRGHEKYLQLWNWKSGQLVWHQRYLELKSMAFLNDRYLIIADLEGRLVVHTYDAMATSTHAAPPEGVLSLNLPEREASMPYDIMTLASCPQSSPPSTHVPFHPPFDSPLLMLAFTLDNNESLEATEFAMFISCAAILSLTLQAQSDPSTCSLSVPWEEWGPANTRLVDADWLQSEEMRCTVLGWKACVWRCDELDEPIWLNLFDFTPLGVRRGAHDNPEFVMPISWTEELDPECQTVHFLTGESQLERTINLFAEDVKTSLPCRVNRMIIDPPTLHDDLRSSVTLMTDGIAVHNHTDARAFILC
ncbi:hypothetical protein B0H21DRAFT_764793 [Amylocystis lapponica]|nr:hypothetical protein B0H21DRAFT_764793 [Amylocystis lapponica]